MPAVTFDGRSLLIDGRRVWIVGGSIHYTRVPRELWAHRIHAAKLAGLNTIETPVFWNRHEARPGHFDFTGDNDLRYFIELIKEADMHCVLRPGPFIGSSWDLGGIPAWLQLSTGVKLRTANGPFLEAVSRFIAAVADQIKDLQATSSGGGPILLIQNEHHWTCGHGELARGYLGEINRYFREAGLSVPVINSNNLWQTIEGEIETWSGTDDMLSTMRQLGHVAPKHPRIVSDLRIGQPDLWNRPSPEPLEPGAVTRLMGEVLAGGGQFIISPFHGGTNFEFFGGRAPFDGRSFVTTTNDQGAPLAEGGVASARFGAVRRIASFASCYARVLSNADPSTGHAVVRPNPTTSSVVHMSGQQGGVAFVFHASSHGKKVGHEDTDLLLPDGSMLTVPAGRCPVSWVLLNTHLNGRSHLDFSTFSVVYGQGKMLLLVGPDGSTGTVSINGSPLDVIAPAAKEKLPFIIKHEGVTLVVCNETQFDHTYPKGDVVFIHVHGLTRAGDPIPTGKDAARITHDGVVHPIEEKAPPGAPKAALGTWSYASAIEHVDGSSPRYARIDGPAPLTALGAPYGYGWYRVSFKNNAIKRPRIVAPHSGDRLLGFLDGQATGISGLGPAAEDGLTLSLKKTSKDLVILADNMGRYSSGAQLGDRKGVFGHFFERVAFKSGRVSYVEEEPLDLLTAFSPMWETRQGDVTHPLRATWSFTHRKKSPLIITIGQHVAPGLLILNGKAIRALDRAGYDCIVLDQDELNRGANTLQIALAADAIGDMDVKEALTTLAASVSIDEGAVNFSEKAEWAFAKWEAPAPSTYTALSKAAPTDPGLPLWWRVRFQAPTTARPLFVDLTGMTKGQILLNGRNVGRYFVAIADGTPVPPQTLYYLPEPWLELDRENDLVLFDEHGGDPTKVKLVYGEHPIGSP